MSNNYFFTVRFDDETKAKLFEFAKTTHRTKAQALRASVHITSNLFSIDTPTIVDVENQQKNVD